MCATPRREIQDGLRATLVDLWLYFVEYMLGGSIRLPLFVQPVGNETLHEKYRIYEHVIPGGYWLCKPFEYKGQTRKSYILNEYMYSMGAYYHIGLAMSGLWPFHHMA
jgi:hypothetical protein